MVGTSRTNIYSMKTVFRYARCGQAEQHMTVKLKENRFDLKSRLIIRAEDGTEKSRATSSGSYLNNDVRYQWLSDLLGRHRS